MESQRELNLVAAAVDANFTDSTDANNEIMGQDSASPLTVWLEQSETASLQGTNDAAMDPTPQTADRVKGFESEIEELKADAVKKAAATASGMDALRNEFKSRLEKVEADADALRNEVAALKAQKEGATKGSFQESVPTGVVHCLFSLSDGFVPIPHQ